MAINKTSRPGSVHNSLTEQSRPVLLSQTNSPSQTGILPQRRQVRRKESFFFRIDSSEETPSSHESIYHAEYFSNPSSEDSSNKTETWPGISLGQNTGHVASLYRITNDENIRDQLLSPTTGTTPIIYGHGTALATIIEQKSTTTICTKLSISHPRSASGGITPPAHDTNILSHRNGLCLPSTVTLRSPRRRRSFSADDLVFIKRSYHNACSIIENSVRHPWDNHEIYAKPQAPLVPPPDRPSTPIGMPSWTAAQNAPRQTTIPQRNWGTRKTPNRLQRLLNLEPRPVEYSSRISVSNQLQQGPGAQPVSGRSASSPLPFRRVSRFRPPKSGHGVGPLDSHPFLRMGSREFKSETYPRLVQAATSNSNSSRQVGATSVISGTTAKTSRKPGRRVRLKASTQGVESRVPAKCPHQGRPEVLQSLKKPFHFVVPKPRYATISVVPPAPTDAQGEPTQYGIPLGSIVTTGNEDPAQTSAAEPLMSGAGADPSNTPTPATVKPIPRRTGDIVSDGVLTTQCWKCRVSALGARFDDIWETSTGWCCWIFCGVDINDDEDESAPGCREFGPRRVVLNRPDVMVF